MRELPNPFHREKETKPEKLADTLVVFGETILDKGTHSLKLDEPSSYSAVAASLLLNAGLADRAVIRSLSSDGLILLESYFDYYGVPKKSLLQELSAGLEYEAEELHELSENSEFGNIAIISPGKMNTKTAKALKAKGITTDSFSLKPEDGKRIVEKTKITDIGKLFTHQILRFKPPVNISLNLLSKSHA